MNLINSLTILLVEDNPDHVYLTLEGFKRSGLSNEVKVVVDGQQALDYLFRIGKYSDDKEFPLPDLILLDIKLPKKDGIEVLKAIKEEDRLKNIPVIMLTTSRDEAEVVKSYNYGANSFISKPVEFSDFMKAIHDLHLYWCVTNTLPQV